MLKKLKQSKIKIITILSSLFLALFISVQIICVVTHTTLSVLISSILSEEIQFAIRLSLTTAVISTIICIAISIPAAYVCTCSIRLLWKECGQYDSGCTAGVTTAGRRSGLVNIWHDTFWQRSCRIRAGFRVHTAWNHSCAVFCECAVHVQDTAGDIPEHKSEIRVRSGNAWLHRGAGVLTCNTTNVEEWTLSGLHHNMVKRNRRVWCRTDGCRSNENENRDITHTHLAISEHVLWRAEFSHCCCDYFDYHIAYISVRF